MTPFTDISAAIEEADWISARRNIRYSVYQGFGGVMEVSRTHPDRNAMYTTTIDEGRAMRNTWTTENLDILIRDYATTATDLLASLFDKPRQQVTNKARELGLKKSPEYLESVRAVTGGMRCRDANHTLRA